MGKMIVECSDNAAMQCLIPLMKHMADSGNCGHSFPILVDELDEDTHARFDFDGDGNHYIGKISWESGEL